jgi:hypothetical protein
MDEWDVHPRLAAAAATAAQEEGLARVTGSRETFYANAARVMQSARDATDALMREGLIPEPPG